MSCECKQNEYLNFFGRNSVLIKSEVLFTLFNFRLSMSKVSTEKNIHAKNGKSFR